MKLRLVENLKDIFYPELKLEFDVKDLAFPEDILDVSGTLYFDVPDVSANLWDIISEDNSISETDIKIFESDDEAWGNFLKLNLKKLADKYDEQLKDLFFDEAQALLYKNWSKYYTPYDYDGI